MTLSDFFETADSQSGIKQQTTLLRKIADLLQTNPACIGAAVAGSLAKGTADYLSDIDLVVFCSSGSSPRLLSDLRSVAESSDVLYHLAGWHDEHSPYEKTILMGLVSYEFHIIEPPTRFTLKAPYIELVNKSNTLQTRFSSASAPERSEQLPYLNGDEGLAWELFNCFKWACRKQTPDAKRYIKQLAIALNRQSDA